jgi:hypothetical protein
MSGRLDRAFGRSSLKSFRRSNRTLEYSKLLDIVLTCCHVVRTACRDFPNSVDFWKQTPCWILINLASERCCSDVQASSMFICKTLRGVRMPSKARPNGCTRTGCFCLGFCKDSSWTSLSSLWSVIFFDLIIVWIHEDSESKTDHHVKLQPLHKVFLFYPECNQ